MDEEEALEVLRTVNVWWEGEPVPESIEQSDYKRNDFHYIIDRVCKDNQVIPIHGPRQVGKTTIVGQIITDLIEQEGVDPRKIVYINMENSKVMPDSEEVIKDSLEAYETNVLKKAFNRTEEEIYIFIDEIQKAENWPEDLKRYTDIYSNLKFIVTGSISTLIDEQAKETLVGRLDPYLMLPAKYVEYPESKENIDQDRISGRFNQLRGSLKNAVEQGDPEIYLDELKTAKGNLKRLQPELKSLKNDYLLKGGYPAVISLNYVNAFNRLDNDIKSTVTGDIPSVFSVQKPEKMLKLLELAAYSSGQKINVEKMARTTNLSNSTVEEYLKYLEEFFLISRSERYSGTPYDTSGKEKIYVPDTGILNTMNGDLNDSTLENNEKMGQIVQTATYELSKRLQFFLSNHQDAEIYYWDKEGEVDLVMEGTNYLLPMEVKNGSSTSKRLKGVKSFIQDYDKADFGIAVNNSDELELEDNILHVPTWLYFLTC
ncbi:MAG: ATP-binding protein [Candidatus Nanohaloarchaea archaeon]